MEILKVDDYVKLDYPASNIGKVVGVGIGVYRVKWDFSGFTGSYKREVLVKMTEEEVIYEALIKNW